MNDAPLVSVCITVFNGEAYLDRALQSVAAQTFRDYEVVVVDDGSSDRSAAIAESAGARVVRQSNGGVGVARQRLLHEASGEWIAFLDHDDRWEPEYLQKVMSFSSDDRDVFRYAWVRHDNPEGETWEPEIPPLIGDHPYGHVLPQRIWPTASVFRRQVLLGLGGFRPELKACEDWLVFFELATKGRFAYLDERLATVMRRTGSTSAPTSRYYDYERAILEDHILPRFDVMYPDMTAPQRALYLRETKRKLGLIKSLLATWIDHEGRHRDAMEVHRQAIKLAPTLKGVWYRYLRSAVKMPARLPGMG